MKKQMKMISLGILCALIASNSVATAPILGDFDAIGKQVGRGLYIVGKSTAKAVGHGVVMLLGAKSAACGATAAALTLSTAIKMARLDVESFLEGFDSGDIRLISINLGFAAAMSSASFVSGYLGYQLYGFLKKNDRQDTRN